MWSYSQYHPRFLAIHQAKQFVFFGTQLWQEQEVHQGTAIIDASFCTNFDRKTEEEPFQLRQRSTTMSSETPHKHNVDIDHADQGNYGWSVLSSCSQFVGSGFWCCADALVWCRSPCPCACERVGDVMVMGTLPQLFAQTQLTTLNRVPSSASLLWAYDFLGSYERYG